MLEPDGELVAETARTLGNELRLRARARTQLDLGDPRQSIALIGELLTKHRLTVPHLRI